MKPDDVQQFFGSVRKAVKAIGITEQAFYQWIYKDTIPLSKQRYIELLSKGKLVANEDLDTSNKNHLPAFRYYDQKYGMCEVKSIEFRVKKPPKIKYKTNDSFKNETLFIFSTDNLMKATDRVDSNGKILYEGDICLLKNGEKFIFKNIEMIAKLKKLDKFTIIGNIFECIK